MIALRSRVCPGEGRKRVHLKIRATSVGFRSSIWSVAMKDTWGEELNPTYAIALIDDLHEICYPGCPFRNHGPEGVHRYPLSDMVKNMTSRCCLHQSLLIVMMMLWLSPEAWAGTESGRFFLMGDGQIKIKNLHSGREVSASLLNPDGSLNEEGFTRIDEVFQFPTREKGEHISPRLIFMLDYFSDRVAPGKVIKMESGYRSPDHNSGLRNAGGNVAPTSLHMDGMALDFSIDGVKGKTLWELIKSKDCCGVGHYGGASVHLDAGRPRFWEAATSKVRTGESDYNRRLYLSTDCDRYRAGDTVRLTLAAVSDFGFGIIRTGALVDADDGNHTVATVALRGQDDADCLTVPDRKTAHSITFTLPQTFREGRYRVKIEFCRRPFEQMPRTTLSNPIEILRPSA